MMEKDVRWKQRFQNFEKAYNVFWRILDIKNPNAIIIDLTELFPRNFPKKW